MYVSSRHPKLLPKWMRALVSTLSKQLKIRVSFSVFSIKTLKTQLILKKINKYKILRSIKYNIAPQIHAGNICKLCSSCNSKQCIRLSFKRLLRHWLYRGHQQRVILTEMCIVSLILHFYDSSDSVTITKIIMMMKQTMPRPTDQWFSFKAVRLFCSADPWSPRRLASRVRIE